MSPSIRGLVPDPIAERRRPILVGLGVVVALVVGFAGWYAVTPHHGSAASVDAVRASETVTLTRDGGTYVLRPADRPRPETALVFYPGGHVHPDAYLGTLAPVVERANVTVLVPTMPAHLAVLDADAADSVRAARPGIDRWYVGGHSLGGAMACRYAANHQVSGLVLFAAYCDRDLGDSDLRVLSVTGTRDAVLNREAYRRNRANLPEGTTHVAIEGMNHSQFGTYRGQRGGRPATVDDENAHARLADAVSDWLAEAERSTALAG